MKLIKIFYYIEDDIDYNCLNNCPFGELKKCGSVSCSNCKHCFGNKSIAVWDLSKKILNMNQGYIYCDQSYEKITLKIKIRKLIYRVKRIFKK